MKLMQFLWTCAVLTYAIAPAHAQNPEPEAGLVALHQACLDASTDGIMLNVAAHPDDESSRTNTMLRRKYGLRVVTVYTTYGDGGQNAIGKEIGPELAWLRVRETMRASSMMDVEVRWLGMRDFGYSKTLDETLAVWGKDTLLAAMRKVVDEIDPDFVMTNHDLTHGHGHHRASFWAISEVLKERQAKQAYVPPLYSRCSLDTAQVTFDPGELDPVRGETYARIAHRAWTQHVTQGPWGAHEPLQVGKDYWKMVFPDGVSAAEAADPRRFVRQQLAVPALKRDPASPLDSGWISHPELARLAQQLLPAARRQLEQAATSSDSEVIARAPRIGVILARVATLQQMLLAIAGVRVETWLERDEVPRGGEGKVFCVVHGVDKLRDLRVQCRGRDATAVAPRVRSTFFDAMPAVPTGATPADSPTPSSTPNSTPTAEPAAPTTLPGRLALTFAHPAAAAAKELGPEPAWIDLEVSFTLDGVPIHLRPRLPYTPVDAIQLAWDRDVVMVPRGQTVERIVSASVKSWRATELAEPIRLSMGRGIKAEAIPGRVSLSPDHPEARLLVRATFTADELGNEPSLRLEVGGQEASLRIVPVEVFVPPGLRIGLVRGPDDTLERALADLGIAYVPLERDALATARLDDFATLLLDMRAYHHVPELAEHRDRILQFCRAGGRVVAMYHKPGEWNERRGHPLLAPFSLVVGSDRITEEASPVTMLQPEHRLWRQPHTIGPADFEGWVQERGLNFPSKWDPAWTPLLELKDSGDEKASHGALLYTQYGRGDFVYCSLVLYRQLRVGNVGAARLLVNLLAR